MKTYLGLFRGINVGGKNLIPMRELAALLEKNGCRNVKTYIQSGNVVFQGKKLSPAGLGKLIEAKFGFKPEVIILEKSEFELCVKHNPFNPVDGKAAHFYFCSKVPKLNPEKLEKYVSETEEYTINNKVFYLYAPSGIGRSRLVANIESCLGVSATGRNLNTINKLREMIENA